MKKFNKYYTTILEGIPNKKMVIIYPGRFQPFHMGHFKVYQYLKQQFPAADVYIASSNKVEPDKSPFNFEQKKFLAMGLGVESEDMIQCANPYQALEIVKKYNSDSTVLLFAISKKDMTENPRFAFKPKVNGEPGYLQPYNEKDINPLSQHGYMITTPTFPFKVLGRPAMGASDIRNAYRTSNEATRLRIIKDLYGRIDKEIVELWNAVLVNNKGI